MKKDSDFTLIIEKNKSTDKYLRSLWRARDIFYFLSLREIYIRYKQTIVGTAWVLIRPLLTVVIFTILFHKIIGLSSAGQVPYTLLVLSALLPWQFFSSSLSQISDSLVSNSQIIKKVYFPRLVMPLSVMVANLIDLIVTLIFLIIYAAIIKYNVNWKLIFLPLFLTLNCILCMGFGLWFASLNIRYRDIRHILPFVIQIGIYASPIGFTSDIIPLKWQFLYSLNPMVGIIEGCRWSILGCSSKILFSSLIVTLLFSFILLISGMWYLNKTERIISDIL